MNRETAVLSSLALLCLPVLCYAFLCYAMPSCAMLCLPIDAKLRFAFLFYASVNHMCSYPSSAMLCPAMISYANMLCYNAFLCQACVNHTCAYCFTTAFSIYYA